jgi:carboxymethylenebutenolidase
MSTVDFGRPASWRILANVSGLQRYIAEEIATDHVDGLLTRREAMRRLGLLGLTATAASALIAACGNEAKRDTAGSSTGTAPGSTSSGTAPSTPPGMDKALPTQPVTWAGPNGVLQGAWAAAPDARGGVLVIHENRGLNDWVRSVAGRFAGVGYSALAIDLLSEEGGTAKVGGEAEAQTALGNIAKSSPERLVADLKSGVVELQSRVPDKKLAVVGFCFGGGLVWQLLASGEPQLAAAVPFYGPLPDNPDFGGSKAAVLAIYGGLDKITSSKDAAEAALKKAGLVNDIVVEPNADHAFFNDTGPRYNPTAAADAWPKVLDWFGRYV